MVISDTNTRNVVVSYCARTEPNFYVLVSYWLAFLAVKRAQRMSPSGTAANTIGRAGSF